MPKIIVDVECGAKECQGGCPLLAIGPGWDECRRFGKLVFSPEFRTLRAPACIAAEADLTRLVECAKKVVGLIPRTCDEGKALDELEAALAPFGEKK